MMKLLKISENELGQLDRDFNEVERTSIEDIAPKVIGNNPSLEIDGRPIEEFDIVYADIPADNAIFGRVLLEMIEENGVTMNYSSTAFFIMAKKNYLYHVLHEKDIPAPKTAVVADEKSVRNIQNHLKGPLVARKFEGLNEAENTKIETVDRIKDFAEGSEYGENIIIFNELREGEKYRCLVAGDEVISLVDDSEGWRISSDGLKYSSISTDLKQTVRNTAQAIGTNVAEVLIRKDQVVDVNPNPDLETYTEVSGKNAYELVTDSLKEERE